MSNKVRFPLQIQRSLVMALVIFGLPYLGLCGEYNQVLSIGDPAPQWEALPGVDGKDHPFSDWENNHLVVVVFTCNSCPYAVDAEDRLIALHEKYSSRGVAVVAINVNKVEEDMLPAMKDRAKEKAFPFAYLYDESQQIAKRFGAMATPECYLLDRERRVRYMGSIDDSPDGRMIEKKYLESSITALLNDQTPKITETVPIGCRVRYERVRGARRSRSSENGSSENGSSEKD